MQSFVTLVTHLLLVLGLSTSQVQASKSSCRAIALSGGSAYGAWEAGVIWGLTHYGDIKDYEWDVSTGISAGSINTVGATLFSLNETYEMAEWISDSWLNIVTDDIFSLWPHPEIGALIHSGYVNDTIGLETLRAIVNSRPYGFQRKFTICATDVENGEWVCFNQTNIEFEELAQAAMSSASIAGTFPPQHFKGHILMDGGMGPWGFNLDSAVQQCIIEMGYSLDNYTNEVLQNISVDVAICGKSTRPQTTDVSAQNTFQNRQTAQSLKEFWGSHSNFAKEFAAWDGVQLNYYFQFENECPYGSMDFNGNDTWCFQEQGRADAQTALELGQDQIRFSVDEWTVSKSLQIDFPDIAQYIISEIAKKSFSEQELQKK